MTPRLELSGVGKRFGSLVVMKDVSFALGAGERTALIGPNGAGKTTLVNIVSGSLPPSEGAVRFEGRDIGRAGMAERARRGLVRTFQVSRLFGDLTVEENLRVALLHRDRRASRLWPLTRVAAHDAEVAAGLAALGISALAGKPVNGISLGEKRLVELAIALAMRPRLLLLDEPAAGIPRSESHRVLEAVNRLPEDLTVLLIEHDMDIVFNWARRVVVLASGMLLADGPATEIARHEEVRRVYFGEGRIGA